MQRKWGVKGSVKPSANNQVEPDWKLRVNSLKNWNVAKQVEVTEVDICAESKVTLLLLLKIID